MRKLADLRGKMNAASTELGTLAQKDERTADEESRLDALLAEINDLGPKLQREIDIDAAAQAAQRNGESRGRIAGTLPAAGAEQREMQAGTLDRRSLGRRFAESEQVRHYRESTGGAMGKSTPFEIGSFYHRHTAGLEHQEDMSPQDVRAIVQTGILPADYLQPQFVPGFFRGDDLQGTLRDVLINGQTTSDAITFFRELVFTNAAAPVGQATATTGATGLKPESGLTFEQATAPVKTIAHWIPITRQTLWDAPQMETYVNGRLLDGLRLTESDQLLNGDGTGENLTGLLATSGRQLLDNTPTTGYWATNPLPSAGADRENFDRILHAKTLVRTVGRGRANFVVLNPEDVERFVSTVDANQQYYGAGPFGAGALPPMWGLRIVEDENLAAGKSVVGDGRMAAIWDRMQSQILTGYIDDQFVRNMLTILAEERLALTVFRPQTFAEVDLAAW